LKIPTIKRAGGVPQGVGPEFKPSTAKKKPKKPLLVLGSMLINSWFIETSICFEELFRNLAMLLRNWVLPSILSC
jgi:hypothetical protein